MTQDEYFELFKKECEEEMKLTGAKNKDYAGVKDAFQNFRAIAFLTGDKISVEQGILVRLSDKFQRVINLIHSDSPPAVKDEKVTDTLRDISVYAKILKIYLQEKPGE